MKSRLLSLYVVCIVAALAGGCRQDSTAAPKPGSAELAVLILDYETYDLEAGAVLTMPQCPGCSPGSLPLTGLYEPPGDFGSVTFVHTASGDTVFSGGIVWMGRGPITHPDPLLPAADFDRVRCYAPQPDRIEMFDLGSGFWIPEAETVLKEVWRGVADRVLVHCFAQNPFQVGLYLYTPAVGGAKLESARWIVFLSAADEVSSGTCGCSGGN